MEVPLASLLSDRYTLLRRPLIDLKKASLEVRPGDPYGMRPSQVSRKQAPAVLEGPRDTTTCVVADRWGNVVAATPSGWGSQVDEGGGTGVTHGTRLVSLIPGRGTPTWWRRQAAPDYADAHHRSQGGQAGHRHQRGGGRIIRTR